MTSSCSLRPVHYLAKASGSHNSLHVCLNLYRFLSICVHMNTCVKMWELGQQSGLILGVSEAVSSGKDERQMHSKGRRVAARRRATYVIEALFETDGVEQINAPRNFCMYLSSGTRAGVLVLVVEPNLKRNISTAYALSEVHLLSHFFGEVRLIKMPVLHILHVRAKNFYSNSSLPHAPYPRRLPVVHWANSDSIRKSSRRRRSPRPGPT